MSHYLVQIVYVPDDENHESVGMQKIVDPSTLPHGGPSVDVVIGATAAQAYCEVEAYRAGQDNG